FTHHDTRSVYILLNLFEQLNTPLHMVAQFPLVSEHWMPVRIAEVRSIRIKKDCKAVRIRIFPRQSAKHERIAANMGRYIRPLPGTIRANICILTGCKAE